MEASEFGIEIVTEAPPSDALLLTVHGVKPISSDLLEGLMRALRARIDEVLMRATSIALSRNVRIRLSEEDSLFLRPTKIPTASFYFQLPEFAKAQISTVKFYLSQHLELVYSVPNFSPEFMKEWV